MIPAWQDEYPWFEIPLSLTSPTCHQHVTKKSFRAQPEFSNEVFHGMKPIQKKVPVQVLPFDDAVDRLFKGSGRHLYILRKIVGQK